MDTVESDADLIVASWDDPSRFADIFRRHYRAVYGYAVRAAGTTHGEDIASEVFVRAFSLRRRYDPAHGSAGPWLFGIAAHLVADDYRRKGRQERAFHKVARRNDMSTEFESNEVARLYAEETIGTVNVLLARLRPEERVVVGLHVLAELSLGEVSEALGIPLGTVKSRFSRARSALYRMIAPTTKTESEAHG